MIEEFYFDNKNNLYREIKNTYNDKNLLVKTINRDQVYYAYNKQNDIIKREYTDGEDFVSETTYTFKYDCYSNWIEKTEEELTRSKVKNETAPKYTIKGEIIYY